MLQEATGLPAHEVQCTTKHSGRTFLPHTSKERDEPMDSQLELAGWFGSSVALDGLPAKEFERYSDLLLQSRTPNGYASQSTFEKVFRTVQGNCEAVNEALGETLPILSRLLGDSTNLTSTRHTKPLKTGQATVSSGRAAGYDQGAACANSVHM